MSGERSQWRARYTFEQIVGKSRALRNAVRLARLAARSDAPALITGASGVGKEMFAQAIHAESRRARGPFVSLNCSAVSRELVEAELFGYAPGAYTGALRQGAPGKFQLASGGTLFLDEAGEMPLTLQATLLRALAEGEVVRVGGQKPERVDVRVIVATNRTLEREVAEGNFREDLYFRINALEIRVPSLAERPEDVAPLSGYFLARHAERLGTPPLALSPGLAAALAAYSWPGNVRELQGVIEREVLHLAPGETTLTHVPDRLLKPRAIAAAPRAAATTAVRPLAEVERDAILHARESHRGDLSKTARALGISRTTLYRKLARYGLA